MELANNENWDIVIKPKEKGLNLNLGEVWRYKDLLVLYIHRNIVTTYKQTILGPLWYLIQPVFSTLIFTLVFGGIAGISTDGLPQPLFYMLGLLCWNFFSDCLGQSSSTFSGNAGVFSKVYFPRLVVPIAGLVTALFKIGIQTIIFSVFYIYYIVQGADISFTIYALLIPLLILMLAGLGFGIGIIISSVTIKYRDMSILIGFAIGLLMYLTPVIYPLSAIPERYSEYIWIIKANPLTSVVETFKLAVLGSGTFSWGGLLYSFVFSVIIIILGILNFNKVERRFVDIV